MGGESRIESRIEQDASEMRFLLINLHPPEETPLQRQSTGRVSLGFCSYSSLCTWLPKDGQHPGFSSPKTERTSYPSNNVGIIAFGQFTSKKLNSKTCKNEH